VPLTLSKRRQHILHVFDVDKFIQQATGKAVVSAAGPHQHELCAREKMPSGSLPAYRLLHRHVGLVACVIDFAEDVTVLNCRPDLKSHRLGRPH